MFRSRHPQKSLQIFFKGKSRRYSAIPLSQTFTEQTLEFTVKDIIEAIEEIYQNAASGPDEVPALLLKNWTESLAIPIHLIWSQSMAQGHVPDQYKLSHNSHLPLPQKR